MSKLRQNHNGTNARAPSDRATETASPDIPPAALLFGWLAQQGLTAPRERRRNPPRTFGRPYSWRARFPGSGVLIFALSFATVPVAEGADVAPSPELQINDLFDATEDAAARGGFYFGTRGRIGVNNDSELRSAAGDVDIQYDPTFGTAGLVGYNTGPRFGPVGFRGEFEAGFFTSDVDRIEIGGAGRSSETSVGSLTGFTGFANGYLDAHFAAFDRVKGTPLSRLTPFVGAGVGVAHVGLDEVGTFTDGIIADDWDTTVAFQVSAGVRVNITPRTLVELGYRREMIPDLEFDLRDGSSSDLDLTRDLFTIGIQRSF